MTKRGRTRVCWLALVLAASPSALAQIEALPPGSGADSAALPPVPPSAAPNLDPAEVVELYATSPPPLPPRHVLRPDLTRDERLRLGRSLRRLGITGLVFTLPVWFLGMFVLPERTDSTAALVTGGVVAPLVLGTGSLAGIVRGSRLVRASRPRRVAPRRPRVPETPSETLVPIPQRSVASAPADADAPARGRPPSRWGRFRPPPDPSVAERLASLPRRGATRALMVLAPAFVALTGGGLIAGAVEPCGAPTAADPARWSCAEARRYLLRTGVVTVTALVFEGLAIRRWRIRRAGVRAIEREGFRVVRAEHPH